MKRIVSGVFVLAACAALISLGVWQVHRLAWKLDLIARIDAQAHVDASRVDLAAQINDPANNLNRGYLEGRYVSGMDARIGPRENDGHLGYWIISPLKLQDGRIVLVNRGWSAEKDVTAPAGRVVVIGRLRESDKDDQPIAGDAHAWHRLDVSGITTALKLPDVAKLTLFAETSKPRETLVPAPVVTELRNDHKQYAIFWFTMAAILFGGYVWFSLRGRR